MNAESGENKAKPRIKKLKAPRTSLACVSPRSFACSTENESPRADSVRSDLCHVYTHRGAIEQDACRKNKVRCEGGSEADGKACHRCTALKVPCLYKEKPQKRQHYPRDYVEGLERRIEAMEAYIRSSGGDPSAVAEAYGLPLSLSAEEPGNLSHNTSSGYARQSSDDVEGGEQSPLDSLNKLADGVDEVRIVEVLILFHRSERPV